MRRTRRVCGPFVQVACRWCAVCKVVKGRRPADGVGGPRTQQCGDAKHSVKAPSAWRRWELQADKTAVCGTQAKTCFRGPVLRIVLRRWVEPPPAGRKADGMFACFNMRTPRARLSAQSFRTPLVGKRRQKTGKPWRRTKNGGDDARPYSVIPGRASKSAVADLDIDNDPTRVTITGISIPGSALAPRNDEALFDN